MTAPSVPVELQVWDAGRCAEYLGQARATFLKRTQFTPGFPERCPIPGHPRWRAREIIAYALGDANGN